MLPLPSPLDVCWGWTRVERKSDMPAERRNPPVLPKDRPRITHEPDRAGQWTPDFPDNDWLGFNNMGGGRVPSDFKWKSNPKERQEKEKRGLDAVKISQM